MNSSPLGERKKSISRIEADHAISLSLRAAREDGSWWSGQPVFLEKRVLGVWPSTPDVVLLLATAVRQFSDIDCADAHLSRFIDWLEIREVSQSPSWWKDGSGEPLRGWSSEAREPEIDVWTTATAVKALLEIREIIEERLWSICKKRFTVLTNLLPLTKIDPVDLGARHDVRLQTRLLRNAARAQLDEDEAEYSYMLHGPPGSSKSILGQGIGREMWSNSRGHPRFVRITPADFTRRGESGLDVEARFIFRLLSHVRGATIFFDEIDDLLRVREIGAEAAFIRLVVPGMLNRLQDLRDSAVRQGIAQCHGTVELSECGDADVVSAFRGFVLQLPFLNEVHRLAEFFAPLFRLGRLRGQEVEQSDLYDVCRVLRLFQRLLVLIAKRSQQIADHLSNLRPARSGVVRRRERRRDLGHRVGSFVKVVGLDRESGQIMEDPGKMIELRRETPTLPLVLARRVLLDLFADQSRFAPEPRPVLDDVQERENRHEATRGDGNGRPPLPRSRPELERTVNAAV